MSTKIDKSFPTNKLTDGTQISKITSNTAKDGTGTDLFPLLDADGHLQVDIISGGGGSGGAAETTGFITTTPILNGNFFQSALLNADGYTQVQTEVSADQDGEMLFEFCSDAAGTTFIIEYTT